MSLKQYIYRGLQYVLRGQPQNIVNVEVGVLTSSTLLQNKVAIVTGGTSGIGYEITKAFIKSGAIVVITGRNEDRLLRACTSISMETNSKGRVYPLVLDNKRVDSFCDKIDAAVNLVGSRKIDILVNNAGLVGGELDICTEEEYDDIVDTNLKGVFFLSQTFGRYLIKNNIKGNILNIGSSSCLRPAASAYTVSKWGINGLTRGLAKTLVQFGITVNGIAPGLTATPMLMHDGLKEDLALSSSPIGRYIKPEEIANMAVILTSNMGKSIVGDMVYMTGVQVLLQ